MPNNPLPTAVKRIAAHYDAEIFCYAGPIDRPYDDRFIRLCKSFQATQKTRTNFLLMLTTLGGDPHAAYRISRFIQETYRTVAGGPTLGSKEESGGKFYLYVDTVCKSAGTIVALGANALIMSDCGEIGPIDVQIRKGDEVGERSSGLTPQHALQSLDQLAKQHFIDFFKELRFSEELVFSTKLASEVASRMTIGLLGRIYSQVDPMRIGELDRAMRIAAEYGNRLAQGNLKDDALTRLLTAYPAHAFVIDRKEARDIFNEVNNPIPELLELGEKTRHLWRVHLNGKEPLLWYLTDDTLLAQADPDEPQPSIPAQPNPAKQPDRAPRLDERTEHTNGESHAAQ